MLSFNSLKRIKNESAFIILNNSIKRIDEEIKNNKKEREEKNNKKEREEKKKEEKKEEEKNNSIKNIVIQELQKIK